MLALRLCGAVALRIDGDAPVLLGSKALALLSVLVLEPRAHRREELTALLWGEFPEEKARASFRQALTHLREAMGGALRVDRSTVELAEPLSCDVSDFLRLAREDPRAALEIDVPAFLDSLSLRNSPGFDEWADGHRALLLRRYRELLASCVREALATRRWPEAARVAERWRSVDPLGDEPVAALVEAHYLAGDASGARAVLADHQARLASEGERGIGRVLKELAARLEREGATPPGPESAGEPWYEQALSFTASLVGRDREWAVLRDAWEGASRGPSRVVVLEGEPGVGKSRLAEDFARWATSQHGVVLRCRGYDAPAGPPSGAAVEMLGSALDHPALAGVDPQWLGEIARVIPDVRRRFPRLQEAGPAGAAEGWRLFEGMAQVVMAIAEESPAMVLVDDLQWCDPDSCSLLHHLVRRLQPARVLWCATFSPGGCERDAPAARLARALRAAPGAASTALRTLGEEEVWQIIRELARVSGPTTGRRLAARLHEVTAGSPFYVMELLKTMFERRLLVVDAASGRWMAPTAGLADSERTALSPTVHEAVAERIACLPDELHAILIAVAVAGRGCRSEVLSHLHGISRLHAAARADSLVQRHLVADDEGVYRCAHPIIAHVVRQALSSSRRREVHRGLALALEQARGPAAGGERDGEIAYHAEQAGEREMAYRYALSAGESCARRLAFEEALSWLTLAARHATGGEESGTVDRLTARVLEEAGWREAPPVRAPAAPLLGGLERADLDLPARI